ncbi:hypothetical protein ANN_26387 [Periplaneta americana]|uniref:Uncharacterized protein n=1 Tax=Periplaneta americana TaxID=6978 RepID=A0ABQ8RY65_PERAM|nr:hypothetical protein ANN_26387 [Periplaneta americana]
MSIEVLPPPSNETLKQIWSYFNLNEQSVKEAVDSLKKWLEMQPHLPNTCEDDALAMWLIRCKNSVERTKESIDMYYTMRTLAPEYLTDRDTRSEWFQKITSLVYCIPMPELTENLDRVIPVGLLDPDATFFNLDLALKALIMHLDVRLHEDYHLSNIGIIDMKNYTLSHVTKITVSQLKKCFVVLFVSGLCFY